MKRRVLQAPDFLEGMAIYHAEQGNYQPLIKLLEADIPLSGETRKFVADILAGKIKRPAHRPRGAKGAVEACEPASRVRELERQGWKRTAAVNQIAGELGMSERSVQTSLKECEPLLETVAQMAAQVKAMEDDTRRIVEALRKKLRS